MSGISGKLGRGGTASGGGAKRNCSPSPPEESEESNLKAIILDNPSGKSQMESLSANAVGVNTRRRPFKKEPAIKKRKVEPNQHGIGVPPKSVSKMGLPSAANAKFPHCSSREHTHDQTPAQESTFLDNAIDNSEGHAASSSDSGSDTDTESDSSDSGSDSGCPSKSRSPAGSGSSNVSDSDDSTSIKEGSDLDVDIMTGDDDKEETKSRLQKRDVRISSSPFPLRTPDGGLLDIMASTPEKPDMLSMEGKISMLSMLEDCDKDDYGTTIIGLVIPDAVIIAGDGLRRKTLADGTKLEVKRNSKKVHRIGEDLIVGEAGMRKRTMNFKNEIEEIGRCRNSPILAGRHARYMRVSKYAKLVKYHIDWLREWEKWTPTQYDEFCTKKGFHCMFGGFDIDEDDDGDDDGDDDSDDDSLLPQLYSGDHEGPTEYKDFGAIGSGKKYCLPYLRNNYKLNMTPDEARTLILNAMAHTYMNSNGSGGSVVIMSISLDVSDSGEEVQLHSEESVDLDELIAASQYPTT